MFCLYNQLQHKDENMMRNHLAHLIKINNFVYKRLMAVTKNALIRYKALIFLVINRVERTNFHKDDRIGNSYDSL